MHFKVKTIEQFKILKFIEEVFDTDYITIALMDRYTIQVTDRYEDSVYFTYKDGEIITQEDNPA